MAAPFSSMTGFSASGSYLPHNNNNNNNTPGWRSARGYCNGCGRRCPG